VDAAAPEVFVHGTRSLLKKVTISPRDRDPFSVDLVGN
jgi:hypothetical protein